MFICYYSIGKVTNSWDFKHVGNWISDEVWDFKGSTRFFDKTPAIFSLPNTHGLGSHCRLALAARQQLCSPRRSANRRFSDQQKTGEISPPTSNGGPVSPRNLSMCGWTSEMSLKMFEVLYTSKWPLSDELVTNHWTNGYHMFKQKQMKARQS